MLYLSPLLIYFPRVFSGLETQPVAPFVLCFFGFWMGQKALKLRALIATLFLILIFFSLLLLRVTFGGSGLSSRDGLMLLGPFFLLGLFAWGLPPPSSRAIGVTVIGLVLVAALEVGFPSVYATFAGTLLERTHSFDGHRGISLLTPEPTYAAIGLAYLLGLAAWTRVYEQRPNAFNIVAIFLLLLGTLSTYAMLFVLCGVSVLFLRLGSALILVLISTLCVIAVWGYSFAGSPDNSTRFAVALNNLATINWGDPMRSLSDLDPSLGTRAIGLYVSIQAGFERPFGIGIQCGSLGDAIAVTENYWALENTVIADLAENGCLVAPSYIQNLLLGFGAASALFAVAIGIAATMVRPLRLTVCRPRFVCAALGAILLLVQAQISNPAAWFLAYFALVMNQAQPDRRRPKDFPA